MGVHETEAPPALVDVIPYRAVGAAIAGCACLALSPLAGFRFAWGPLFAASAGVALLLSVSVVYDRLRRGPRIAAVFGSLGLWIAVSIIWGLLSSVALGLGLPLQDANLAALDGALGIDHRAIVTFVARSPAFSAFLGLVYLCAVPLMLALATALPAFGQFERARRLLDDSALLLAITIIISALVPAGGSFVHLPYPSSVLAALPPDAGMMHFLRFEALRDGTFRVLDPTQIEGLATFPSYHVAMAFIVARALWGLPWLGAAGAVFAGVTILSTLPIGGHYVVDILATCVLYLMFCIRWRKQSRTMRASPQLHASLAKV